MNVNPLALLFLTIPLFGCEVQPTAVEDGTVETAAGELATIDAPTQTADLDLLTQGLV